MRSIFIIIALSFPLKLAAFDGIAITGTNFIAVPNATNDIDPNHWYSGSWLLYGVGSLASQDFPEGGWYTTGVSTNVTFTAQLPSTLPSGTYRVQLKAVNYDDSLGDARNNEVTFMLGGGSNAPARISDRDDLGSRWLSHGVNLTSLWATNRMTMVFSNISTLNIQLELSALYITTNLNEDVDYDRNDLIVDYTYPASISTNLANTNNILSYSSFEAGVTPWRISAALRFGAATNWISYTDAVYGSASLRFAQAQAGNEVSSPYFWPKPDSRQYNLGVSWKGSGSITVESPLTAIAGLSNTYSLTKALPLVGSWTRTNFPVFLRNYPNNAPYQVTLVGASNTLFDGVMLHEGTNAAPYKPMGGIELGWSNSVPGAVYYSNSAATPYVIAFNGTEASQNVSVYYEFWDKWNTLAARGNFNTLLADGAKSATAITLPAQVGWYRVIAWSDNVAPQETTVVKMVDPGPSITGDFIGTHNSGQGDGWQMQMIERLGISWTRATSPDAYHRWSLAEPTENNFLYYDNYATNAILNNNTVTLGCLGVDIPAYAGTFNNGHPVTIDQVKLSNYVYAIVFHYKAWITNWEVFNEPAQGQWAVALYTNTWKTCVAAARAADPNAYIIALGGVGDLTYALECLSIFGTSLTNYCNAISIHGYPAGTDPYSSGPALAQAAGWKAGIVDVYGPGTIYNLKILNTESGGNDYGNLQTMSSFPFFGVGDGVYSNQLISTWIIPLVQFPWQVLQHALAYKAYGFERYFYYDSRMFTDATVRHYTSWETGQDNHKIKIAALAVLNELVAGTTGGGVITPTGNYGTNIVCLYFENGNDSLAATWSTNAAYQTVTIANVIPYDHMGSPIATVANAFRVGRMPVYMRPVGLTSAQFRAALTNATVAPLADTVPPGLSIVMFPGNNITDTNRLQIRWSAVDELSLPGLNNQADILTRSKLGGEAYSTWGTDVERVWTNVEPNTTVTVQAKDAAGNVATQTREFGTYTTLNTTTLNVGTLNIYP